MSEIEYTSLEQNQKPESEPSHFKKFATSAFGMASGFGILLIIIGIVVLFYEKIGWFLLGVGIAIIFVSAGIYFNLRTLYVG